MFNWSDTQFVIGGLVVWILAVGGLLYYKLKLPHATAGLLMGHIINMWMFHWLATVIYLLPWYHKPVPPYIVFEGFAQSLYAVLASVAGGFVGHFILQRAFFYRRLRAITLQRRDATWVPDLRVARFFMIFGLFCYFFGGPLGGWIPSVSALISVGWNLFIVGLTLQCWNAIQVKNWRKLCGWILVAMFLPLITVTADGFMGFAIGMIVMLVSVIITFYRPRWHIALAGVLGLYFFLSVFITYMRDRTEIREQVWGGANYSARIDRIWQTVKTAEAFNPYDNAHLERIDGRLNQCVLIGPAVGFLGDGHKEFARGDTLIDGLLMLVPRAVWPNKPMKAGSGTLVADYTGLTFNNETTSVGVGHVLELYINFGTLSVVIGFFLIGVLVNLFDSLAALRLAEGDLARFTFWFLSGAPFWSVQGSSIELVGGVASALVLMTIINRFVLPRLLGARPKPVALQPRVV
jgi:hypothetical protein